MYVNYNRMYKYAELLQDITSVVVREDPKEPRRFIVDITITNLEGNQVSLSSSSLNPTKE